MPAVNPPPPTLTLTHDCPLRARVGDVVTITVGLDARDSEPPELRARLGDETLIVERVDDGHATVRFTAGVVGDQPVDLLATAPGVSAAAVCEVVVEAAPIERGTLRLASRGLPPNLTASVEVVAPDGSTTTHQLGAELRLDVVVGRYTARAAPALEADVLVPRRFVPGKLTGVTVDVERDAIASAELEFVQQPGTGLVVHAASDLQTTLVRIFTAEAFSASEQPEPLRTLDLTDCRLRRAYLSESGSVWLHCVDQQRAGSSLRRFELARLAAGDVTPVAVWEFPSAVVLNFREDEVWARRQMPTVEVLSATHALGAAGTQRWSPSFTLPPIDADTVPFAFLENGDVLARNQLTNVVFYVKGETIVPNMQLQPHAWRDAKVVTASAYRTMSLDGTPWWLTDLRSATEVPLAQFEAPGDGGELERGRERHFLLPANLDVAPGFVGGNGEVLLVDFRGDAIFVFDGAAFSSGEQAVDVTPVRTLRVQQRSAGDAVFLLGAWRHPG